MLESLITASENFIYHQLRLKATPHATLPADALHTCSITLFGEDGASHRAMFYFDLSYLTKVCEALLFEEAPDEATLIDMAKECTNLIAGSAKIIAQEREKSGFDIALPVYEGVATPSQNGTTDAIAIDKAFALAISL
ncbi:MAG: hypothetical protein KU37_10955 [Sulfuricurvum sp. PC08-66]|nr:MAG: hypothetical protein KU37_10955 [Sulfuricurvum sp. PC08-66]